MQQSKILVLINIKRALTAAPEQLIWGIDRKKGFFKKRVVDTMRITNYRVCLGTNCIGLDKLDNIVVMNQRTVSDSNYTSIGIRGGPRIGTGSSSFRPVGDIAFIYQGRPYIVFAQIGDPQGVARLANAARKTLIEKINRAEKMKKAQLQQKQQLKERISTRTTTTSNQVIICPRCSSTNVQASKYCNNCGFRLANVVLDEEGTTTSSSLSVASSPSPSPPSTTETIELNVGKFVTWESPTYGVKINYPSNWRVEKGKLPTTLVLFKSPQESPSDMIFENVAISLYNITGGTLEQLVPVFINQYRKKFHGFTIIESVPATLGGLQAHRLVFDGEGKRFMAVFAAEKNKVYEIGYASIPSKFDSYLPIVQKMLNSFEITANK